MNEWMNEWMNECASNFQTHLTVRVRVLRAPAWPRGFLSNAPIAPLFESDAILWDDPAKRAEILRKINFSSDHQNEQFFATDFTCYISLGSNWIGLPLPVCGWFWGRCTCPPVLFELVCLWRCSHIKLWSLTLVENPKHRYNSCTKLRKGEESLLIQDISHLESWICLCLETVKNMSRL